MLTMRTLMLSTREMDQPRNGLLRSLLLSVRLCRWVPSSHMLVSTVSGKFRHTSFILSIITAVAPWFEPNRWGGGGYLKVHKSVGSMIDWYNVQFYNRKPYLCIILSLSLELKSVFLQR